MTTATLHSTPARTLRRSLAIAAGALALAFGGAAQAAPGGWHGGGGGGWHGGGGYHGGGYHGGGYYRGGGWGWDPLWGVGLGLGLGLAATSPYYYDNGPSVVYVNPPATYYTPAPVYVAPAPQQQVAPAGVADPIFYPRNGQSAAQVEADRQECNRWATTQPKAMADGSVFQRATFACMDGRGYTAR
jgi:hypothetical protein